MVYHYTQIKYSTSSHSIESPGRRGHKTKNSVTRPPEAYTKPSLCDLCDLQVLCVKPYSALISFVDSAFFKTLNP